GSHPHSAASSFALTTRRYPNGVIKLAGDPHNVIVDLPPGFIGNPMVTERCSSRAPFDNGIDCAADQYVGEVFVNDARPPRSHVTNSVPQKGYAAQFNFLYLNTARLSIG